MFATSTCHLYSNGCYCISLLCALIYEIKKACQRFQTLKSFFREYVCCHVLTEIKSLVSIQLCVIVFKTKYLPIFLIFLLADYLVGMWLPKRIFNWLKIAKSLFLISFKSSLDFQSGYDFFIIQFTANIFYSYMNILFWAYINEVLLLWRFYFN